MEGSIRRVPAMEDAEVKKFFNGPEAFTPDGEFILGESEVPGFWVAAGFCAHGLAGAGGIGKVMAEWIVDGQPEWDLWHMDIRRFGRQYRSQSFTLARTTEVYSTYYDIKYPGEERRAGRPLRVSPAYARHPRTARRSARSRAGSASTGSTRTPPTATSRCARAAGPAALVAGDRGRVPGRERARRADRPVVVREDRRPRPRRVRVPRPHVRERGRPAARLGHLHAAAQRARRHRGRRHARAPRERPLPLRDGHGVRLAQPRAGCASTCPEDGSVYADDITSRAHLLLPLGPARARHPAAADAQRPLERGVPVHARAGDRRRLGAAARLARDLRRRARLGALRAGRVRPRALRPARARPARRTACAAAATARSSRCGSRRATARGAPISRPRRRPRPPASASRCGSTSRRRSSARRRCAPSARPAGRAQRLVCLVLDDPRSVCLGSEPVRIAGELCGRVTSGGYGSRVRRSIALAYVPARTPPPARAPRSRCSASGCRRRSSTGALYDPAGERIRA